MLTIEVPNYLIAQTINGVLEKHPVFNYNMGSFEKVVVDFSNMGFIRPTGLAFIVALMKYIKHSQISAKYFFRDSRHTDVIRFLEKMEFYEKFGLIRDSQLKGKKMDLKNFCEIREVASSKDCQNVSMQLAHLIDFQVNIPKGMLDAISHSLSEIIDNIFHHSDSPINGFVCAQTFPNMQEIEIAIVDCGMGIKESLQCNARFEYLNNDIESIALAVEKKSYQ